MPYYTGKGDRGYSDIPGTGNVPKHDKIFYLAGGIDELNSAIGVALYYTHDEMVRSELKAIQNDLFLVGADIVKFEDSAKKVALEERAVARLENAINSMSEKIPEMKKFVMPGGCEAAVHLHVARAIARRVERDIDGADEKYKISQMVKSYMNRLSSYLFVAALYLNRIEGIDESHPLY